jgi:malate dehydrogenase
LITIIGAGRVGATAAAFLMLYEVDRELLLLDIVEGLPQGEAMDLNHAAAILGKDVNVRGSNSYEEMAGSDIVVVTAGFPRRPGMTREELVGKNAEIVASLADKVRAYAPKAITIITTNPLDAMVYLYFKRLGFPRQRVLGFSGVLDAGRLAHAAGRLLDISPSSITAVVLGQHGEGMYPALELSDVGGTPLASLLSREQFERAVEETVKAGALITELRKFSSNWGPGAGLALMCDAIKKDRRRVLEASVYLDGEYGVRDVFAEVPIVLGRQGVERIIEIPLSEEQRARFLESVARIRANLSEIPASLLAPRP